MQLMVIRHAIAELPVAGLDDRERELTADGRDKLHRAVAGLKLIGVRFDHVLSSPWKRAVQTARAMATLARAALETTPLLAQPPGAELLAQIATHGALTAVVGHEPWLGELVGLLAFGDARHGDAIAIKKCGVVWLEGTAAPGGMQIRAVLPPKLVRAFDPD